MAMNPIKSMISIPIVDELRKNALNLKPQPLNCHLLYQINVIEDRLNNKTSPLESAAERDIKLNKAFFAWRLNINGHRSIFCVTQECTKSRPATLRFARFRLTTGHGYLQPHLQRIDLASDGICTLFRIIIADDDHIINCTKLIDMPDNKTIRYWEAWRRMPEQPQTGVG
ncbi:hypothetical protein CDAR_382521 [Caerostris darwini]|uniref:Uncharacterized protein n=1 Tax=Caerostris darwini TaxID=1538125 RepID=A0AAV4SK96_9ARAC|nr:hypothetical protein CDAR_382521 [Caerostris darwini]